ncbi:MAG: zinc-binding alcohol dehydrogenase [Hyphomicrobiaceae bacterium]|nr:zinc-binding alcohol dehydrogenase [Hyphomicrobiaceae bacterium]
MTPRRSTGKMHIARALWYAKPGVVELRREHLPAPRPGEARVRTVFSGISRGTERLILNGQVPESEWQRMRAPLQAGAFPFPVKYGYCAAGVVEDGPDDLVGRTVFCLHPHQDTFIAPVDMLVPVPEGVPTRRATLAANMETALNGHWDAGTGPGDRIVVVGGGILGLLVAQIGARLPGADVTVVDLAVERRELVESMGARFALPGDAPSEADAVFHTSASAAGLDLAIRCAGMEATVIEMSWYGEGAVPVSLGGAFHSRRLKLICSQVGQVSATRRSRWSYRRRIEAALQILANAPALDLLVAEDIAFVEVPERLPAILENKTAGLAPVIRYMEA